MLGRWNYQRPDRKVLCDNCSAILVGLKKQALSLAVHHNFSFKEAGAVSSFLRDNLQVHSRRPATESRDPAQGTCNACGAHQSHLKQEAIMHLALSREHAKWGSLPSVKPTPGSSSTTNAAATSTTSPAMATVNPQSHSRTHSPRSSPRAPHSPRTPRSPNPRRPSTRPPKPPYLEMDRWVEEQQQLMASMSLTNSNGVTIYPYQGSDGFPGGFGEEAALPPSSPKTAHISRVAALANSTAMSFLARAAQKLNLTSKKKSLNPPPPSPPAGPNLTTCFRGVLQGAPPRLPTCLLQAASRTKDSPHAGKVKVMLLVRPGSPSTDPSQPSILQVDPSRRRVTVTDPGRQRRSPLAKAGKDTALPKTYTVDTAFPKDSSQEEVCTAVLVDVIRSVVAGADGCVLGLSCASAGPWSTMVGIDKSTETLGVIPCAISWLYKHMERRKERAGSGAENKTGSGAGAGAGAGAGPIVSVSAMELCEEDGVLRDLLAGVSASGQIRDVPATEVHVYEDPVYGIQLQNRSVVRASDAERAAFLLDAAIASRRRGDKTSGTGCDLAPSHSCHVFFSLHVRQPPSESHSKGSRTSSKLTFIDTKTSDSASGLQYSELASTLTALLSGHQNLPNRGSKLTMLMQDSLGTATCRTTVIGQVSDSPAHLMETLSIVQTASCIRRTQKKAKKSTSCSPNGRSLSRGRRGPCSLSLRAFHSTGTVGTDPPQLRLGGELDDRSSSDQSCDTVIHMRADGSVQPDGDVLPEFVPIIPSLLKRGQAEVDDPEFTALLQQLLNIPRLLGGEETKKKKKNKDVDDLVQEKDVEALTRSGGQAGQTERDCLKCETFAELQERLGCIHGDQASGGGATVVAATPKHSATAAPSPLATMSLSNPGVAKTASEEAKSQLLLGEVSGCPQSVGDKMAEGVFPGESFEREDSGLYDCEEGSAASSSEDPPNAVPTLRTASHTNPAEAHPADPRPRGLADAQVAHVPSSLPLSRLPTGSQGNSEGADWLQMDSRTSPAGKSSPVSPGLLSSSAPSLASSVFLGNILPQLSADELKEMKATITVRVQRPFDPTGQDELVFTMTEEVTISGALEKGKMGGNIIRIRDTQSSAQVQDSTGSRPIRIISNVRESRGSGGKVKSPIEESSRLFSAKLEQLANRTHSLDRSPLEFQPLDRGSSTTSLSSKGSSKGSYEGSSKGSYKRSYAGGTKGSSEVGSTSPRSSRSPRRSARSVHANDPGPTAATSSHPPTHSPRSPRSKLSAVGKLMMASPKVRRLSTPSTKNLSFSPKTLRQSVNRSASLSPDGKTPVSPDRLGSAASPWSTQSLSRTQTQTSSRPSAKTPIRVVNGRISELLLTGREPASNPPPGETVKMAAARSAFDDRLPSLHPACPSPRPAHHPVLSPYSRVTAPRLPGHLSGHASDVTSVLSGELPPAMGKTSLLWPNRNSVVSSGYESMVRDSSENTAGSSASNRDSVSDKSCSAVSAGRGGLGRNVRRRTSTGSHPRRPSHDTSLSLRRSASGPRARWVDRGIPEAYEIKVYEIDDVERLQRRAGAAGKQGVACFSAKLKFLEHRQQRISEVRAKYNSLKKELEHAKQHLMLEPGKWNQEFDLWQTFEVDSLEHLEALEVVTTRLESRVNLCKANVMMVTCFDMSTKKRQKRRRTAPELQVYMGI
ncbi:kinesin-like protein KIF26B [Aplochiton taeniatus]